LLGILVRIIFVVLLRDRRSGSSHRRWSGGERLVWKSILEILVEVSLAGPGIDAWGAPEMACMQGTRGHGDVNQLASAAGAPGICVRQFFQARVKYTVGVGALLHSAII
jgi:hypothetical protein